MIDAEQLIKGLEYCQGVEWCLAHSAYENCPYPNDCIDGMKRDALELIKSQQERKSND